MISNDNGVLAKLRKASVVYELENSNTSIGRGPDNDIVLDSQSVSKAHCIIEFQKDGSAALRDLQSRNGTFVNSERIHNSETVLMHGDFIRIGYEPENFQFDYANPPSHVIPRSASVLEPEQRRKAPSNLPPNDSSTSSDTFSRRPRLASNGPTSAWASNLRSGSPSHVALSPPAHRVSSPLRPTSASPSSPHPSRSALTRPSLRPTTASASAPEQGVQFLSALQSPPKHKANASAIAAAALDETQDLNPIEPAAAVDTRAVDKHAQLNAIEAEWSTLQSQLRDKAGRVAATGAVRRSVESLTHAAHALRTRVHWLALLAKEMQHHLGQARASSASASSASASASASAAQRVSRAVEKAVWPPADVERLFGSYFDQFTRNLPALPAPATDVDIGSVVAFAQNAMYDCSDAINPELWRTVVTSLAESLNQPPPAIPREKDLPSEMKSQVKKDAAFDVNTVGKLGSEMSVAHADALRRYLAKLQKKQKDFQEALDQKNYQIQVLSKKDGVRSALEYETQLQTLRSSLSFVEENHQSLFKSFADLESRVSKNGSADVKSELVQFLQDQSRQTILLKRSNAELMRRQHNAAQLWSEKERNRQALVEENESLRRLGQRQQAEFRAAVLQRDRAFFDLNKSLSELSMESSNSQVAQQKRSAAQFLIDNLESTLQQNRELTIRSADLSARVSQLESERSVLAAELAALVDERFLDVAVPPSPLLATTELPEAPLTAWRRLPSAAPAAALVARVSELEDLVVEEAARCAPQRVAELEAALQHAHAQLTERDTRLAHLEAAAKRATTNTTATANTNARSGDGDEDSHEFDASAIIESLAAALRTRDADLAELRAAAASASATAFASPAVLLHTEHTIRSPTSTMRPSTSTGGGGGGVRVGGGVGAGARRPTSLRVVGMPSDATSLTGQRSAAPRWSSSMSLRNERQSTSVPMAGDRNAFDKEKEEEEEEAAAWATGDNDETGETGETFAPFDMDDEDPFGTE